MPPKILQTLRTAVLLAAPLAWPSLAAGQAPTPGQNPGRVNDNPCGGLNPPASCRPDLSQQPLPGGLGGRGDSGGDGGSGGQGPPGGWDQVQQHTGLRPGQFDCLLRRCGPQEGGSGAGPGEGPLGQGKPPRGEGQPIAGGNPPRGGGQNPAGGQQYNPDGSPKAPKGGGGAYGLGADGGAGTGAQAKIAYQLEDFATACSLARKAVQEGDAKAKPIEDAACRRALEGGGRAAAIGKEVAFAEGALNAKTALLRGGAGGGAIDLGAASQNEEAQYWQRQLALARENGDPRAVVKAADELLKLTGENAAVLAEKAMALAKLRDYKGALAAAEKALALDPNNARAWAAKALALGGLGEREGMLAALAKAASLDPQFEAWLAKAQAGDLDEFLGGRGGLKKGPGALVWIGGAAAAGLAGLSLLIFAGRRQQRGQSAAAATIREPGTAGLATVVDAAPSISLGAVVGDCYRIKSEIGRGGMGVVYEAVDETLQRRVAIKQLQRHAGTSQEDLERFIREARLVAQLKHPNLAEIYNVVSAGDPLLVFEFVEGQPLDKTIAATKKLLPSRARAILADVAAALDYAHAKNIIHRDLKPSNVMIASTGAAKVMDFGIAHQARSAAATQTSVSGTPPYMAPEQAMGSVSKAADFYSLGVMAYEMVCGARPFEGPDFLEQKLQRRFVPVQRRELTLPPALDQFFALALDPDPTKRPPTGAHFVHWFDQACGAKVA